jgi:hypothetical protein
LDGFLDGWMVGWLCLSELITTHRRDQRIRERCFDTDADADADADADFDAAENWDGLLGGCIVHICVFLLVSS